MHSFCMNRKGHCLLRMEKTRNEKMRLSIVRVVQEGAVVIEQLPGSARLAKPARS